MGHFIINKLLLLKLVTIGEGDLLIKIPFQESWEGVFSLTLEAWHVNKPKKIPQPPKENNRNYKSIIAWIRFN